jgi:hypothetical protein
MGSRTLITVAAVILATSGIAFAEGTKTGQPRQSADQQQRTQSTQQRAQQEQRQGAAQQETGRQAAGDPSAAGRTGVDRLEAVSIDSLNEQEISELQQRLQELGYYTAEVDGIIGPKTRSALIAYHHDQIRLLTQNKLSEASLVALGFSESEVERVRGVDRDRDMNRQPGMDRHQGNAGQRGAYGTDQGSERSY